MNVPQGLAGADEEQKNDSKVTEVAEPEKPKSSKRGKGSDSIIGPLSQSAAPASDASVVSAAEHKAESEVVTAKTAKAEKTEKTERVRLEARQALMSHMDGVRGLVHFEKEQVLVSVSEDCLAKLWNLQGLLSSERSDNLEPYLTLRGHRAPIFSVCRSSPSAPDRLLYTAGADTEIRVWALPLVTKVQDYGPTDGKSCCVGVWKAHEDTIWDLASHPTNALLIILTNIGPHCLGQCRCLDPAVESAVSERQSGPPERR